jgi:outer membrane biosynthesis protein TonB
MRRDACITPAGCPANIRARPCTSQAFAQATIVAVRRWRFDPQVRDGEPTMYRNATARLLFSRDG